MRLFHGSNMEIDKVDLSKCMPNKDFGRLTNQYMFHTEKALQYLKKVGVMHDKSAAGND